MTERIKQIASDPFILGCLGVLVGCLSWLSKTVHDLSIWRAKTDGNRFMHSDFALAAERINERIYQIERHAAQQLSDYIRLHDQNFPPASLVRDVEKLKDDLDNLDKRFPPKWLTDDLAEIKQRLDSLESK